MKYLYYLCSVINLKNLTCIGKSNMFMENNATLSKNVPFLSFTSKTPKLKINFETFGITQVVTKNEVSTSKEYIEISDTDSLILLRLLKIKNIYRNNKEKMISVMSIINKIENKYNGKVDYETAKLIKK